jgi:ferric-dicitrate binding protein FerR (iron transport regulator)
LPTAPRQFRFIDPGILLQLFRGDLVADVEPREPDRLFQVRTERYTVTVKGTVFAVRVRSADDVTVSVSRGLVEVSGQGRTWQVAAGHTWKS